MFKPSLGRFFSVCVLGAALAGWGASASAVEYPIGKPQQMAGMQVSAVYLQPVVMEPEGMMRDAKDSDVHLEADISALASNVNGFPEGSWVPYLVVTYELTKKGSSDVLKGDMMPMVASKVSDSTTRSGTPRDTACCSNKRSLVK